MRTREELRQGCAELLRELRVSHGLSKSKMAALVGVDDHTWSKYETGHSAPSVPDFIAIFDALGADALRRVLDYLYPSIYAGLEPQSSAKELRRAASHYFMSVASDRTVREWDYLMFGGHGSNSVAQLQEFCMIEHLPMAHRYTVAQLVDSLYRLADARGELVGCEHIMPDVDVFRAGLEKGRDAAFAGRPSYTTSCKEAK